MREISIRKGYWLTPFFMLIHLSSSFAAHGPSWLDTRQAIFFPKTLGIQIQTYLSFPVTWWNFLTLDLQPTARIEEVAVSCQRLRKDTRDWISVLECGDDLTPYLPLLKDWARDYVIRNPRPSEGNILAQLNATLARASLPIDRLLITMFRFDPFESYLELKRHLEKRAAFQLKRSNGFFYDETLRRLLIPIKFAFDPSRVNKTSEFWVRMENFCHQHSFCQDWGMIGPHASNQENQTRIQQDMSSVTSVGTLVLTLFFGALCFLRKWRLLWILPVVVLALLMSTGATLLIFGSIHGLTLSFGSGIVGLSIDYGLLAAFLPGKQAWRSNWFGFLTTEAALFVLWLSQVPLLRQMMIFAMLGLCFAFFLLFLLHSRFPKLSSVKPLPIEPKMGWSKSLLIFVLLGGGFVAPFLVRPGLDLQRFNFQSEKTKDLYQWFGKISGAEPPLLQIHQESLEKRMAATQEEWDWAQKEQLVVENVSGYVPPVAIQRQNLLSWVKDDCPFRNFLPSLQKKLNPTQRTFFEPFFQSIRCGEPRLVGNSEQTLPRYAQDLQTQGAWLTLWFPKSADDVRKIQSSFSQATSLKDLVSIFPQTLATELKWMGFLSFVLVWVLLMIHYRQWTLTCVAYLPFLCGVGLFFWASLIFHFDFSFISLIGIVMLYGLSVDYSIFAIDACKEKRDLRNTWTAIGLAACATISGFVPLIFCRHQVLAQLGQVLAVGTLGTWIGAYWGIPLVLSRWEVWIRH